MSISNSYLQLVSNKLNMMMHEVFQLKPTDIDDCSQSYLKLIQIVLREISLGNIKSIHMTCCEAKKHYYIFNILAGNIDHHDNQKIVNICNCKNEDILPESLTKY